MPQWRKTEQFQQLLELERVRIIKPLRRKIFLSRNSSSCAAEQIHSDASLEAVYRREPNNLKNWQWTTEGYVSAWRWTPALQGGEWPYIFCKTVWSMLVYCCICTSAGFVNSWTSTTQWNACKFFSVQDPPRDKPSLAVSAMGSWAKSLASWLAPCSFLINQASTCGTVLAAFVLDTVSVKAAFQSALSNDIVAEHPQLESAMWFGIIYDLICCELKVISIAKLLPQSATDWCH